MDKNTLVNILGKYTGVYELTNKDWSVVVSEYGGRIIGVFPKGQQNLLWINPNLRKILEERDWNIGGARVWISPEKNFFYRKPEVFDEWLCQRELDPGNYSVKDVSDGYIRLENTFSIYDFLNNSKLNGVLSREIIMEEKDDVLKLHVYENMLTENYSGTLVNLWALVQVYPGSRGSGTVVIPVKENTEPLPYFGKIPPEYLKKKKDSISFRIDGLKVLKIAVRPEDLPKEGIAKIGYITTLENGSYIFLMLSTRYSPRNQKECLDIPKYSKAGGKGCVQSYNSGPEGGQLRFGEIELQFIPAGIVGNGMVSRIDYDLVSYIGSKNAVIEKATELLEIEHIALFP